MAKSKRTAAAAAQTKVAEVKAPETAAKAETAVKAETAAKVEAAAPMKAEAAPKAAVEKKAVEKTVVVEFAGKQVKAKDVLAQAEKAYAESHPGVEIESVELYISPEQNAAFYVVNGEASEEYRIEL